VPTPPAQELARFPAHSRQTRHAPPAPPERWRRPAGASAKGAATLEGLERHRVTESQACEFLAEKYGSVDDLRAMSGGFWSSAYGFSEGGRELVVRFGENKDWHEADRAAMAFASPGVPVPEVIEIGDAFGGGAYAISVRRHGKRLEDVRVDQRDTAAPMLASLIGALYRVPKSPELAVWHERPPRASLTWRGWLSERLDEDPNPAVDDWQSPLAAHDEVYRLFEVCEARVRELIDACPERRDLVHGDLLHVNVLVAEDASRPTAVFSWKCSARGDFLFDVAWCTFWSSWYPGIAAADPGHPIRQEPAVRDDADAWVDASVRHFCYEMHIGATHIGWYAWIEDPQGLAQVVARLIEVLEGGPLPLDA
jgi:aminoglycoside phosphotransferase (APT) family kinase protein